MRFDEGSVGGAGKFMAVIFAKFVFHNRSRKFINILSETSKHLLLGFERLIGTD